MIETPAIQILVKNVCCYTGLLSDQGIQVSLDGKGRYLVNIFVERLWRSVNVRRRT